MVRGRSRHFAKLSALLLALLLAAGYLYEQGSLDLLPADPRQAALGAPLRLKAAHTAGGDWYQLYFTHPGYPERPEQRQGGIDAALVADINAARRTLDMAVFDLDLESLALALLQAQRRGVRVRLVTDDENLEDPHVAKLIGQLQQEGVSIAFDRRSAFMHIKLLIVDDALVWTGSMNFTSNGVYRNNNNMLRFTIPQLSEDYRRRFEYLFAGRAGAEQQPGLRNPSLALASGAYIENFFSPNGNAAQSIEQRVSGARSSIRLLAFSYTADEQARLLIGKHQAGVQVQGVFEARGTRGTGAEFGRLKQAGLEVLEDGNCYIMHHKVYIIDERTVITGSYNFTANAESSNDENLLIIDDAALADVYMEEFRRVYEQARHATRCSS